MLSELSKLKEKLELIEKNIGSKMEEVNTLEGKWLSYEEKVKEIQGTKDEDIISINVGGKTFATKIDTLVKVKDNIFHKIITSQKLDIRKGIFIDRSPTFFPVILDYFRFGKFNPNKFTSSQLLELKEEILYYEVMPLEAILEKKVDIVLDYIRIEVNAWYPNVGSQDPSVLLDENLATGICINSPAWMILELNQDYEFDEMLIGGFTGASDWVYNGGYGANALIETSLDKKTWFNVGCVPSGFGTQIINHKLVKSTARYVRFSGTSWIGFGYLKFKLN